MSTADGDGHGLPIATGIIETRSERITVGVGDGRVAVGRLPDAMGSVQPRAKALAPSPRRR
jgi:hypothetical protein